MAKFDTGLETLLLYRAEVLAMHLAAAAGIDAVRVRLLNPVLRPILVGERFGRTEVGERRPFLSARSLSALDIVLLEPAIHTRWSMVHVC